MISKNDFLSTSLDEQFFVIDPPVDFCFFPLLLLVTVVLF